MTSQAEPAATGPDVGSVHPSIVPHLPHLPTGRVRWQTAGTTAAAAALMSLSAYAGTGLLMAAGVLAMAALASRVEAQREFATEKRIDALNLLLLRGKASESLQVAASSLPESCSGRPTVQHARRSRARPARRDSGGNAPAPGASPRLRRAARGPACR